ncbi:MAG TPA: BglII/BstYI family type II restriction endonuclease [Gemmatimonadales bacterium]|nr:BglII/BstYI family type II restriction endonuclease [Gemmatimonadales bacterium]
MPKIVEEVAYNGVVERIRRLGLSVVIQEIRQVLEGFTLEVLEQRDANGGAAVRRLIDAQFDGLQGWVKKQTGDVDWTKCHSVNGTKVCVGVEVQVSARGDLLAVDILHLRKALVLGLIDVGVIIVPSDELSVFLTDRGPCLSDAKKHVDAAGADDQPLLLMAFRHDGAGQPLAKQKKN